MGTFGACSGSLKAVDYHQEKALSLGREGLSIESGTLRCFISFRQDW